MGATVAEEEELENDETTATSAVRARRSAISEGDQSGPGSRRSSTTAVTAADDSGAAAEDDSGSEAGSAVSGSGSGSDVDVDMDDMDADGDNGSDAEEADTAGGPDTYNMAAANDSALQALRDEVATLQQALVDASAGFATERATMQSKTDSLHVSCRWEVGEGTEKEI